MKKTIITLSLIGSLLIILSSFQLSPAYAIVAFLLAGQIPGTTVMLPPTAVLMIVALIAGFAFARMFRPSLHRSTHHTDD